MTAPVRRVVDEAPQTGRLCSHGWIGCMTANCRGQTAHDRNRQTRGRGSKAGQRPYKPGLAGGSRHFGGGRNGCRRCRSNWQAENEAIHGAYQRKNTPCCRGVPEACISPLPRPGFLLLFPDGLCYNAQGITHFCGFSGSCRFGSPKG